MRRIPSQFGHLIADEFCLQAALLSAYFIRHGTLAYSVPLYRNFALVLLVIDALVALLNDSFGDTGKRGYYIEASRTLWHAFLVLSISLTYLFATQYGDLYSRITLSLMFVFHTLFGYAVRAGWKAYRRGHPVPLRSAENMLAIGSTIPSARPGTQ